MLTTNLPENVKQTSTDEAVSVIHAPESFASWVSEIQIIGRGITSNPRHRSLHHQRQRGRVKRRLSNPMQRVYLLPMAPPRTSRIALPITLPRRYVVHGLACDMHLIRHQTSTHPARPPISTDVNPVQYNIDSATPRAQDLQSMLDEGTRLRSSSTSSLESGFRIARGNVA